MHESGDSTTYYLERDNNVRNISLEEDRSSRETCDQNLKSVTAVANSNEILTPENVHNL